VLRGKLRSRLHNIIANQSIRPSDPDWSSA
jgi:hypothetical protein